MKRFFLLLCVLVLIVNAAASASFASDAPSGEEESPTNAVEITSRCQITIRGDQVDEKLTDDREDTYLSFNGALIEISAPEPIGSVYVKFDRTPQPWTLRVFGKEFACGQYGFLHEYQKIPRDDVMLVMLSFPGKES